VSKLDVPLKLQEKRTVSEPSTVNVEITTTGDKPEELQTINGYHPVNIVDAYVSLLRLKANQPFTVTFTDGKSQQLTPTPAPTPDVVVKAKEKLGIGVEQVTPMLAGQYSLATDDGIFVSSVDKGSVADKAGLQAGDVVVQLGRYRVPTLDHLAALLPHLPTGRKVLIGVVRGNHLLSGYLEL
jgi:predicted metalloprotease with PDZ domain